MITVLSALMWGLLALGGVVVLVAALMAALGVWTDPPQPRSFTPSRRSEPRSFTPSRRSEMPCQCRTCYPGRRAR